MENIIFYKLRKYNDKWVIVFLDNNTNNYTIIKNDLKKLRAFINSHKESILVGANNYITDDKLLTSLIKNGNLDGEVTDEDITELLPVTLDITQGIVRNSLIDFNNMICNLKDNDGNILNYDYALNYDDIEKQLVGDIQIIKSISEIGSVLKIRKRNGCKFFSASEHIFPSAGKVRHTGHVYFSHVGEKCQCRFTPCCFGC